VLAVILVGYLLILIDVSILMAVPPRIHADISLGRGWLRWLCGGALAAGERLGW
jgi:hypothetical protein